MSRAALGILSSAHFGSALATGFIVGIPLLRGTADLLTIGFSVFAVITITMFGFVVNDLFDVERDSINKPYRPLASGTITAKQSKHFALLTVFASAIAIAILLMISWKAVFLLLYMLFYYVYNYINKYAVLLKNVFIALGFLMPFLYVLSMLDKIEENTLIIISTLFYFLYRELLMDVNDKKGDLEAGYRTIPNRVSDHMVDSLIAIFWSFSVIALSAHCFLHGSSLFTGLLGAMVFIMVIQNLVWKNINLSASSMRILLMSMWIPMVASPFLLVI